MNMYRQQAERDAIERWNVGRWQEWEDIHSPLDVFYALVGQALANHEDAYNEQTDADADVIWSYLCEQREAYASQKQADLEASSQTDH